MRIKELDSLRGIAAVSVMLFHYTTLYTREFGYNTSTLLDFSMGHYGVDLFFIISGFVIFMTISKCISNYEFLYKRFIRLYPTYWVCLLLSLFVVKFNGLPGRETSLTEALVNLTMLQGLFHVKSVDGAYWSLLCELLFYAAVAVLFSLHLLKYIRLIGVFWMMLAVINALVPIPVASTLLNLPYGMLFFAGIVFYKIASGENRLVNHLLLIMSLVAYIIVYPGLEPMFFSIGCFAVFYLAVFGRLQFIATKPLVFLGGISYSLYLLHQNIGFVIIGYLRSHNMQSPFLLLFLPSVMVIALATIVTYCFEKPLLSYLRSQSKVSSSNVILSKPI